MALTKGSTTRREHISGQEHLTFADGSSRLAQGVALVDESGDHAGIATNPLDVVLVAGGTGSTVDPLLEEAKGNVTGLTPGQKFGRNPSVAAATVEDIWTAGGAYTGFLTAASAVRIKAGGDANDTSGGTGAQTVTIEGLDENWAEASETVTLAGASASAPTTTTFIRVSRAYVATSGTYGEANAAAVDIETTGGTLMARIGYENGIGLGQTQMMVFTVPAGYTLYFRQLAVSADASKSTEIYLWQRRNADDVTTPFSSRRLINAKEVGGGTTVIRFATYGVFPAKTDLWASALGPSGGGAVTMTADYVLVAD